MPARRDHLSRLPTAQRVRCLRQDRLSALHSYLDTGRSAHHDAIVRTWLRCDAAVPVLFSRLAVSRVRRVDMLELRLGHPVLSVQRTLLWGMWGGKAPYRLHVRV